MSPTHYVGLHQRYEQILQGYTLQITLAKDEQDKIRTRLSEAFSGLMSALFRQKGATLDINILASDEAQNFISTHADILDQAFQKVPMTEAMRRRLTRSDYIFSGLKTFHELNEAFPSLLDENGNRKSFEQFYNDVQKIDKTYNQNYLHAVYNFVHASAEMAAKWEQYAEDGDRYNLQYRTAGDDKVRPEHAALNGVTLPMSDPFWETYYPPNGWNCRCTVVQVRKSKYATTPRDEAMARGEEALQSDTKGIFWFNPGSSRRPCPTTTHTPLSGAATATSLRERPTSPSCPKMNSAKHAGLYDNVRTRGSVPRHNIPMGEKYKYTSSSILQIATMINWCK